MIALAAALVVSCAAPAFAQNTGGAGGGANGNGQQTKPAEAKPAEKWTSPFKGSQSTEGERADFDKLVPLWDKSEEATDKLEYARKCGTKNDIDAAQKAAVDAFTAWRNAVAQYIMDYEPNSAFQTMPRMGQRNYNFFVSKMGLVTEAVKKASKYKHKPVGDCPKKAAETTPAQTVPSEVAPEHSSNPHKHKHPCREDEACAMEGVAVKPHETSSGTSAPVSNGGTVYVPPQSDDENQNEEHRPDYPAQPAEPDVPLPPDAAPPH